ncbi:MAG TPA: hypothetical protein DGD08_16100 [Gemmatimonas aurantiaca]|uniref:Uncharacterized protein n=2 Tax=Gemmatimonas aurantiaca TaxID=173480 RepID=C1A633_GEMAT|nr:hypothetical protein [Gemmatimonas aurantiaca]BAH37693.1 hypothetical protein GAU_0651 [Gemmatimonas aurantiaca T-27]HCT58729.1 hypothetical protein [Gemmatimonas aurantiaca]
MTQGSGQQRGDAAAPQISEQPGAGGERVITVPDGKGNVNRIVINDQGISINGEEVGGAAARAITEASRRPEFAPARARKDVPNGAIAVIAIGCSMVVAITLGSPLVRSFARWLDRRGDQSRTPNDVAQRLAAIEQAVELVAVEVERISEGQRFTAKLLAERSAQDMERVR